VGPFAATSKILHGREHEWAMPTEMLADRGAQYRARLLEQGLIIWPTPQARFGLHEYLAQCPAKSKGSGRDSYRVA